jgi:hypothetical protein
MTSGIWNVGSIANHIGGIFGWSTISSLSGTTLNNIIEQEINYTEQYTTESINSSAIPEKYQPAVIDLTQSKVLLSLESQQGGVDSVHLGELAVSQGAGGGAELAKQLRADAIQRLKELQRAVRFKRVIGGI